MVGKDATSVIEKMDDQYRHFKYLEGRVTEQKEVLKQKLPEIEQALDIVKHLKGQQSVKEPMKTHFELTSHIWGEADITKNGTVYLWLGANIMVEYTYDEAIALLSNNFSQGKISLENYSKDLDYLKDQITVTEVNVARIFNWDVKERRKNKNKQWIRHSMQLCSGVVNRETGTPQRQGGKY